MSYFECKVSFDQCVEGKIKKITAPCVVNALSCAEAEAMSIDSFKATAVGDIKVKALSENKFSEIIFEPDIDKDYWWKAVVSFIHFDEKTAKEVATSSNMLVNADCFQEALEAVRDAMKGTLSDWSVESLSKTKITGYIH